MINIAIAEDNNIALNTLKEKLSAFPDIILNIQQKMARKQLKTLKPVAK